MIASANFNFNGVHLNQNPACHRDFAVGGWAPAHGDGYQEHRKLRRRHQVRINMRRGQKVELETRAWPGPPQAGNQPITESNDISHW